MARADRVTLRIEGVELRRVRLPLVSPFRTATGTQHQRDALLVRVRTTTAEGWGECVAMSDPTYSPEYVDGAQHVLQTFLLPALFRVPDLRAEGVAVALAGYKGHRMAKAAIEMALLDAELRVAGVSFARHLGGVRDAVPSGVSIGIAGSIPELLDVVGAYLDEGYTRVKIKVEPGWDLAPVAAVREHFGDHLLLQVDANGAYTLADAGHLAGFDRFGLLLIEQPFAEDALGAHAELARQIRTPICLDESITSARVAADAIAMGACSVVNIKAGRVGGYLEARRIHDVCAGAGVPVWCGGMLETGIGRAANVALASLPNCTLPGDISASGRFYLKDITPPFVLENGCLRVPQGPGLGVDVLADVVEDLTTWVEFLPA